MESFINSIVAVLQGNYTTLSDLMPTIILIAGIIIVVLLVIFLIVALRGRSKK